MVRGGGGGAVSSLSLGVILGTMGGFLGPLILSPPHGLLEGWDPGVRGTEVLEVGPRAEVRAGV